MAANVQVPPNCDLTLGMVCVDKATPGRCTWRMTADERFANPSGIMQGGFLAAFADSAMGAAAVTFVQRRKVFAANAEMKISFLAPIPPGTTLTCTAEVVSGGSTVAFVEASIVAQEDGHTVDGAGTAKDVVPEMNVPTKPCGLTAEGNARREARLVARASSTYIFRTRAPDR